MARVLVTVGMSEWPFDRLIRSLASICAEHDVFAQIGSSTVVPPCPSARFLEPAVLSARLADAEVVVTHAGNTVRVVQRLGKVPIAVAREAKRGEMANDHQVDYLRKEEQHGRVVALWDPSRLAEAVRSHTATEPRLLAERPLPEPPAPSQVVGRLEDLCGRLGAGPSGDRVPSGGPFAQHPLKRYAFAWEALRDRAGLVLDLGCGTGEFLLELAQTPGLRLVGADVHGGYLQTCRTQCADLPLVQLGQTRPSRQLPFTDEAFEFVTLLDVLEHTSDEESLLADVHRILKPGGLLVLTVPAHHQFSFLDPDNAKSRFPKLHRLVYAARFGEETYRQRFTDLSDGLRGDMAADRLEHTNYRPAELMRTLERIGFDLIQRDGANLFWRWFQVPALLAGPRVKRVLDRAIAADARWFASANLFLLLRKAT